MKPELAMTIDAARDLAWRPMSNLGGNRASAYEPRLEAHRRLVDALAGVTALSANASPQLEYLVRAIRRVAACSFSNRMGLPYYERKQAVAELRGLPRRLRPHHHRSGHSVWARLRASGFGGPFAETRPDPAAGAPAGGDRRFLTRPPAQRRRPRGN